MTYQELKAINLAKNIQWQYSETAEKYSIFSVDGIIRYDVDVYKAGMEPQWVDVAQNTADRADFEANYKTISNRPAVALDATGIPLVSAGIPTSSDLIDTRQGVYKLLTPLDNIVEFQIPYTSIILMEIRFDIKNTEPGDRIETIEMGFDAGGWVQVGWYGKDLYFNGGDHMIEDKGNFKSDPIPQGLTFRFTYTFANPASIIAKPCAIWFKFGRPFA